MTRTDCLLCGNDRETQNQALCDKCKVTHTFLMLDRKEREAVVINTNITVSVSEIVNKGKVRLGITAPREYPIFREELL